MKRIQLLIVFYICMITTSQSQNIIKIGFGIAENSVMQKNALIGAGSHDGKGAYVMGAYLQNTKDNWLKMQVGVEFIKSDFIYTTQAIPPNPQQQWNQNMTMISLPVQVHARFLQYFFVQSGISIDTDFSSVSHSGLNDQSGIGINFSLGAEYQHQQWLFFASPFLQQHAIVSFTESNNNNRQKVILSGVKVGLGYRLKFKE